MDREQLFRNLTELEIQLKGIQSATEQVNNVVKADRELAATINAYAHTVNEQVQLLKQIFEGSVSQITNQAKGAIKQSSDAVDSSCVKFQEELSSASGKIRNDYQEILNHTHAYFKTKVDEILLKISTSCTNLDDISQNRLPSLAESLSDIVENSLRPLVNVELKQELTSNLSSYKEVFDNHAKDVKSLGEDVVSSAKEVVDNIKSACDNIPNVKEVAKSESDRVIQSVSAKFESTVADLKILGDSMIELKSAIQQDIEVSQKAAEDTVQAIYKLDGLPEYIKQNLSQMKQTLGAKVEGNSRSLKNLSSSIKELKEELKNQEAKFEELKKSNKALLCMVIVSMLMTVIVHFI